MLQLHRIHHAAIIVSDYERSKYFYTQVMGLKVIKETYRPERNSYKLDLSVNDQDQVELFSFPNPPSRPSYPEATGLRHLAFEVDNLEKAISEIEYHQISVEDIRTDKLTGKRFTFFADPDGLPIELYER